MFLKLIGGSLVFAACALWGFFMATKWEYRIKDLRAMRAAYKILYSEIDYGLLQLKDAMENAGGKTKKPVSDIFIEFGRKIRTGKNEVNEIWSFSLEKYFEDTYFEKEDLEIFKTFGKALGYLDKNMQLSNIDSQINYIDGKITELLTESPKNKKMYSSLGVLSGLLIFIIIL